MEGDVKPPRLARAFYKQDGWASDPHLYEGQASSTAEKNLQPSTNQASDPHPNEGQASSNAANNDLQTFNNGASDPSNIGQASTTAANNDLQIFPRGNFFNSAVNKNLHLNEALCGNHKKMSKEAPDPHGQANPFKHFLAASDSHQKQAAPFLQLAAPFPVSSSTAAHLYPSSSPPATPVFSTTSANSQSSATMSAIPTSKKQQPLTSLSMVAPFPAYPENSYLLPAASTSLLSSSAAPSFIPSCPATPAAAPFLPLSFSPSSAHPASSPANPVYSLPSSAIPILVPTSAIPTIMAIPALLSTHAAIPHAQAAYPLAQGPDEVVATSSSTLHSSSTTSIGGSSRLRAMASPWTPGKPALPFLYIGDIPLSPWLSSPTTTSSTCHSLLHSLLLPGARHTLANTHPVETLGDGQQPSCCLCCGHSRHLLPGSSSKAPPLSFSRLRGANTTLQSPEDQSPG